MKVFEVTTKMNNPRYKAADSIVPSTDKPPVKGEMTENSK